MMNSNYSVTVSQNEKWVEDEDGKVKLEFGKPYTVRLKNRTNTACGVDLYIDGKRVANGSFFIPANSFEDIKGFYDGSSKEFIFEALSDSSKGNFDGEVSTLEARFYKVKQENKETIPIIIKQLNYPEKYYYYDFYHPLQNYFGLSSDLTDPNTVTYEYKSNSDNLNYYKTISIDGDTAKSLDKVLTDKGYTKKGKKINQSFNVTNVELEDEARILKLEMCGFYNDKECKCGNKFASSEDRYCSKCGKKR